MHFSATVLSLLLAAPPITVEVKSPGASAEEIETAVVLPLEQALGNLKGVRSHSSLASDGRALVRLQLDPQANPGAVYNAVQMSLWRTRMPDGALPVLQPAPAETVELLVLRSKTLDRPALSQLAFTKVLPPLVRFPGGTRPFPRRPSTPPVLGADRSFIRATVDLEKLAALPVTFEDLQAGLRKPKYPERPGRVVGHNEVRDLIIPKRGEGRMTRLRDIATLESSSECDPEVGVAYRDGKATADGPAILLVLQRDPGDKEVPLDDLKKQLPEGARLERHVVQAHHLMAALRFPAGSGREKKAAAARKAARQAAEAEGVHQVLWLARKESDEVQLLFVPTSDARGALKPETLRASLKEVPGATLTLSRRRPLSDAWPGEGMDLVFKLRGDNLEALSAAAGRLGQKLAQRKDVTDILPEIPVKVPRPHVEIDRVKAGKMNLPLHRVLSAAREFTAPHPTAYHIEGQMVHLEFGEKFWGRPDALHLIKLRSDYGHIAPLSAVATVKETQAVSTLYREQGKRCVVVACNVADRGRLEAVVKSLRELAKELSTKEVSVEVEQ